MKTAVEMETAVGAVTAAGRRTPGIPCRPPTGASFGGDMPSPAELLTAAPQTVRAAGLSASKVATLRAAYLFASSFRHERPVRSATAGR